MYDLQDIINFQLHPIDDLSLYVKRCRSELQKNSILILKNADPGSPELKEAKAFLENF